MVDIIEKYEIIKQEKRITNIDTILNIVRNTNWKLYYVDAEEMEASILVDAAETIIVDAAAATVVLEPSAPPLQEIRKTT